MLQSTGSPGDSLAEPADLTDLSLEDLLALEVSSVSRREQPFFETPAAVTVLTPEDLRRSGARNIAEALRLVPGLQVARINSSQWAISARGFNNQFANKLLVLIDGRSVYTPLFGGVYWDVTEPLLEDVERIEVIRGPGATSWGANAVNGVINIITKSPAHLPSWTVSGGGGTEERAFGALRWAGSRGSELCGSVFLRAQSRDRFVDAQGRDAADDWDELRSGARVEWVPKASHLLALQGEIYGAHIGQTWTLAIPTPPFTTTFDQKSDVRGGDLSARWTHAASPRSRTVAKLDYTETHREEPILAEKRRSVDFDFQQELELGGRNHLVGGLGFRYTTDEVANTFVASVTPDQRSDRLYSAFVQDEITFVPHRFRVTLGSKFEHNDATGFEVQPGARLLWTPGDRHTVWAAVSRAVRTPTRVEEDVRFIFGTFLQGSTLYEVGLVGNPDLKSDELLAWEAGYRVRATPNTFVDMAAFYNDYGHLGTFEPLPLRTETEPPPPHVLLPTRLENHGSGETWGTEIAATWDVTQHWRLLGSWTYLRMDLHRDAASQDAGEALAEGSDPRHQLQLHSRLDLGAAVSFDAGIYGVGRLRSQDVPEYARLDVRVEWRPSDRLRLEAVGQNLLEPQHPEFGGAATSARATEVQRGVYGRLTWRR